MRLSEKIRSDARSLIPINTIQTTHGTDHKLERGLKIQPKLQSKPYWVRLKPIAVKKTSRLTIGIPCDIARNGLGAGG
jgi:hypothetical protein